MALFSKKPAPEMRTANCTFRLERKSWHSQCECDGKDVSVDVLEHVLTSSVAEYVDELVVNLSNLSAIGIAFAKSQADWPDDYCDPELEQLALDGTDPSIFFLRFTMELPLPPIFLEVKFIDKVPTQIYWEFT